MKSLGLAVQEFRKGAAMTQDDLAEKSGLTQGYISMIESGRRIPRLQNLEDIARTLRVRVSTIIGRAETLDNQ